MSNLVAVDEETTSIPEITDVRLGPANVSKETAGDDPFLLPVNDIKKLDGLSPVAKRRMTNTMNKYYRGIDGAKTTKIEVEIITGYNAFEVIQPQYNMAYLARLYEVSTPHFAAVNAKSANIVGLGYSLVDSPATKKKIDAYTEDEKDQKNLDSFRKRLDALRSEIIAKLESMNQEDTFSEILNKVWIDYEATGNGYIEIGRTVNGEIGYLGHIASTTMRVRKKRDGFVQIVSNKAVFFRNFEGDDPNPFGTDQTPNEVIHLKKYTPTNAFYGIPDVIPAKNAVAGMEFGARYNLDYFENKAVPRYIIVLKGAALSGPSERSVLEFFETGLKGKNHRSLYIPLPAGDKDNPVSLDFQAIEAGTQEGSFSNYMKESKEEILMAHRVPISKVSSANAQALAAARDADKTFKEQVCQPLQRVLEKKLNRIMSEITNAFVFAMNELSLTDEKTQADIYTSYVQFDIMRRNEIRAKMGLPGTENGDAQWVLNPQQAADAKATATQSRARDTARNQNAPDTNGESRQPKGEGRATP